MGAKSTYIDRTATNAKVMEMAQTEANREGKKEKKIMKLSDLHRVWRINMLAKVINQGNDDPNTAATLQPETLQPHDYGRRRVGRPRAN